MVLIDPLPPLTLTSDKSTECYRNWWPTRPMADLMGRSIDLLEEYAAESGDAFQLNRRGYVFAASEADTLATLRSEAEVASALGAGPIRTHGKSSVVPYPELATSGVDPDLDGADFFVTTDALMSRFPYLSPRAAGGVHVRRAGWLSAQQLGSWMLDHAVAAGAAVRRAQVVAVAADEGRFQVTTDDGPTISAAAFVNAAGPLLRDVGALVGVDLPVHSEVHQKVSFRDHEGAFPREAPMVIWSDRQRLEWSAAEAAGLRDVGRADLLDELPRFCHGRPEGSADSPWALGLWEWKREVREPAWPLPSDDLYPELVLRGLTTMLPALDVYRDRLPESVVDGGYYTKTPENLPILGPAGPAGSFVCGALSGYGVMAAPAAGELVAHHIAGSELPAYADAFRIERYDDPGYRAAARAAGEAGQL